MGIDISIVIPSCGRTKLLKECLNSILNQDYPRDRFEIVIVDDNYLEKIRQENRDLINSFKDDFPFLTYIYKGHKGPAAARNRGIKAARGKIIGFVDDDCVLDREWISLTILAHKRNPTIMAIGGDTFSSSSRLGALVSQFLSTCSIESDIGGRKEIVFFPTCNVSLKRKIINRYKFNENFSLPGGEDLEFFWHLFKLGYRFIWDRNIKVIHKRDGRLIDFARQAYIYGKGNLLVQYFHKNHPLLKEIKTGPVSFWVGTLINIAKIPRFSYLLGKRFIKENNITSIDKKFFLHLFFAFHKFFYIFGNVIEFFRLAYNSPDKKNNIIIPKTLILDVTHRCNLKCRVCDIWKTKEEDISKEFIKKALLEAKKLEIKEIALSGGEPLLKRDIFEIFDYARKLKVKNLGVLTNGLLVNDFIDRLRAYLLDNTITLVISFDSLKPNTHNYIRGSSSAWQKTESALSALSSVKSKYPQINFSIITIILNQNLEELFDLADFIKAKGANSLQFQPILPNNLRMAERTKSPFWVIPDRLSALDDMIDKLIRFKEENPDFIKNSSKNLALIKKHYRGTISYTDVECSSAKETVLVSNQGKFTTCFSPYGDIKKQSLTEIFCSKERAKAYEKVKKCMWPCLLPCFCDL